MYARFLVRFLTVGAVAIASSLAATAWAADVVIRLGNDVAPTSIQARANEVFAEEVAKRDVGIEVNVFHSNQLGTGVQQIQNVRIGVQEMVNTGWELLSPYSPDIKVAEVPYMFSDVDHYTRWIRSPFFEQAHQKVIKNGNQRIINLGVLWLRGPFRVMIATRPVLNLNDLSQIKVRTHESDAIKKYWGKEGMGATVVVLPLADTYLSLRQGVVDGFTMPFDLIVPFKWGEVAKHIMYTRELPGTMIGLMISESFWQSLNDDQRKALSDSADAAGRFYNNEIAKNVDGWMKELKEMGVTFHEIDRQPLIEKSQALSLKLQAEGFFRPGLIDEIQSLTKN